jgi:hypothetical protein
VGSLELDRSECPDEPRRLPRAGQTAKRILGDETLRGAPGRDAWSPRTKPATDDGESPASWSETTNARASATLTPLSADRRCG